MEGSAISNLQHEPKAGQTISAKNKRYVKRETLGGK